MEEVMVAAVVAAALAVEAREEVALAAAKAKAEVVVTASEPVLRAILAPARRPRLARGPP